MEKFLNNMASGFGVDRPHYQAERRCVSCHKVITSSEMETWSHAGRKEFDISGVCEPCFDNMFSDEGDYDED